MKLKTDILFTFLLRTVKPCVILDIGSRDGIYSIQFKKIVLESKVIEFEENPYNYKEIINTKEIIDAKIIIENNAVSDKNGELADYL